MADLFSNPNDLALASLGLRLMSTPGKFGPAIGTAGLGALNDLQQAQMITRQRQLQDELLLEKQEEIRRRRAAEDEAKLRATQMNDAYRNAFVSPREQALGANAAGPTVGNLQAMQQARPKFDRDRLIESLMKVPGGAELAAKLAQPEPDDVVSLAPGATAYSRRDNKALFTAPGSEPKSPASVQEYEYAKAQGYTGSYEQWRQAGKPAGTTVNINTEKPLLNTVAQGLGKQLDDSLAVAKAAVPAIQTAQTLRAAVDSGKLIAGPGASFRVLGLQVGQMMGIGGKDGAEILANTRVAIQSMAQAELSAAQQMKGQGQITEAERAIIKRAAAGDINDLTAPEIGLLANAMEKTARYKIDQHKRNVQGLSKMPGAEPLMPFYQIEEPAPYSATGAVRRYNPKTGKIE